MTAVVPQLLTMDELAERLNVTRRHVRRLVAERRVPFLKIGKFVRFDAAEVGAWLDSNRVRCCSSEPCYHCQRGPGTPPAQAGRGGAPVR